MSENYPHLGPFAVPFIGLEPSERVAKIRERRFTDFPRCRYVMDLMDGLFDSNGNLLFWGESGAGKTTIIKRYLKEKPPRFDETTGVMLTPVVAILMPPVCNPVWLFEKLLDAVNAPQPLSRPNVAQLEKRIIELYGLLHVRLLIIDEVHDMLGGTARQQRAMLNVIRHLTNQLGVPLVLFGTQAARTALIPDPQLARRFTVHNISSWTAGEDFEGLIGTILRTFPLKRQSSLTVQSLRALLTYSRGNTGRIFETLIALGIHAVQSGQECITGADVMEYTEMKTLSQDALRSAQPL